MVKKRVRCAIYTRKSSEEGLEQNFNSLHAQREAGEAYIASQAHEGWRVIKTPFDDGGWSGGSLERPALQALLTEISAGRVDVVVIYKIDRLTRSLTDFAKLAELLDEHDVSFVSVTQPFNTTTSMGRLMLNVLLSFAQFEREITGERIRDKIAASKKKGIWMGGFVPLGYDAVDRELVIVEKEANTVRKLFALYLKLCNVRAVWTKALTQGWKTKINDAGQTSGGRPFSRGHIYRILRNPIYAGWIAHQGELYKGLHQAIIEQDTWDRVQTQLTANARKTGLRQTAAVPGLLVGLLYTADGQRLTHAHSTKNQRRYRYYIDNHPHTGDESKAEQSIRIPANQIEVRVKETLIRLLKSPTELMDVLSKDNTPPSSLQRILHQAENLASTLEKASPAEWIDHLQSILTRVTIDPDMLGLLINRHALGTTLGISGENQVDISDHEYRVPAKFITRSGQMKLIIRPADESEGGIDETLIRSVARAHAWFEQLQAGQVHSIQEIANLENLSASYVMKYLRLAFLAPDIVEIILKGRQPPGTSVKKLINGKQLPSSWTEQRQLLNFPSL